MSENRRRFAIDPVCEMDVEEVSAPFISYSGRRVYFFCSQRCKLEFDLAPNYHLDRLSQRDAEMRLRVEKMDGRRRKNRRRSMRVHAAVPSSNGRLIYARRNNED